MTQEDKQLDILGKCPCCEYNWDGGLITERMENMKIFFHENSTIPTNIANTAYGANDINPKKFSKLTVTNFPYNNKTLYTCPNIICKKTFDIEGNEVNLTNFKKELYESKEGEDVVSGKSIELFNYNER